MRILIRYFFLFQSVFAIVVIKNMFNWYLKYKLRYYFACKDSYKAPLDAGDIILQRHSFILARVRKKKFFGTF